MSLLLELGCGSSLDFETQVRTIQTLLDAGASPNVSDTLGYTAVHYAAALGITPAMKVFVERHADLNHPGLKGVTPIEVLASSMKLERKSRNPREEQMLARLIQTMTVLIDGHADGAIAQHAWLGTSVLRDLYS